MLKILNRIKMNKIKKEIRQNARDLKLTLTQAAAFVTTRVDYL